MHDIVLLVMGGMNVAAGICMLCYNRKGSTFKRHVSVLAYLLSILVWFNAFRMFADIGSQLPFTYPELVWQFLFCLSVICRKGNVSFLFPKIEKQDAVQN